MIETLHNPRWYLLQSKPRQERRALENLEAQHFECLLPLYPRERLRRGQRVAVDEPLFPRYLFVRLNEVTSNWYRLRSTWGVTNIVRFGDTPAVVPDAVVAGFTQLTPADRTLFHKGDKIHMTRGPFTGLEGVFDVDDGEQRVFILLEFMGKQQRLSLPVTEVAAAA